MRILPISALFFLAGCANLTDDLKTAGGKCAQGPAMAPFITCLNGAEEPVFQKDSPADVPAYRAFASARLNLAEQLDAGKITPAQFTTQASAARAQFAASVSALARARQAEQEQTRNRQTLESLQGSDRPGSGPGMGDMGGMGGGMGNMGM